MTPCQINLQKIENFVKIVKNADWQPHSLFSIMIGTTFLNINHTGKSKSREGSILTTKHEEDHHKKSFMYYPTFPYIPSPFKRNETK